MLTPAPPEPLELLTSWIADLDIRGGGPEHYVTLATASADGIPSSRTVQLLSVEPDALLFTTNIGSRKGVEMRSTGHVAVSMYWPEIARSVNVTGSVVLAADEESDARFAAEPRTVQAARTVSFHGLPLDDEEAQLKDFRALCASAETIVRPDHWRWFRVVPDAVTFWQAAPDDGGMPALNQRLHYAREENVWTRRAIQA